MTSRFDRDTAVLAIAPGEFSTEIERGWWIVAGPNGGYLSAILLRGMVTALDDPERTPRSFTVHFSERAEAGPALVRARIERAGRSMSTLTARLEQDERTVALALAAFSKPREGRSFQDRVMPVVPAPETLPAFSAEDAGASPFRQRFETRPVLGSESVASGKEARTGGWIRPADPRPADPLLIAALCDSWPPAIFTHLGRPAHSRGAPTIDLTVHFRSPLPPESREPGAWFLGQWRTRTVEGGFLEEDGEIWSRDGTLLAQSRQLAIFA